MSKSKSQTTEPIPACGYYRMSSDQQEASISQQKEEVQKLAKTNGYIIIKEYVDEGKSGSLETSKRTSFLRLIKDSHQRSFKAVLLWDVARWGRLDPLKSASYKDTLRSNGVHLHTCKEGKITWDSFSDFVVDTVHAAAANAYSKSLSKDTIRGRLDLLESGAWPNGKVPYGYSKVYTSREGKEYHVARTDTFAKGKGWSRALVIVPEEAKVIQHIFDQYVNHDQSMREIAKNIKAVRPDGEPKPWTKDTVRATVTNKAYAGYAHIGGLRNKLRAAEAHNRFGYHEKAGAVPAIVPLEWYERAVAKITGNKEQSRKVQPSRSSPISGILICGHCGYRLDKHSRTDASGQRYNYFSCSSAVKRPGGGCKQWRIREDYALPILVKALVEEVDRAVLESAKASWEVTDGSLEVTPVEALQRKLKGIKAKINQGLESYLEAPAHLRKALEQKLAEWTSEQESIEREASNLTLTEGDVSGFTRWWESVRGNLVTVAEIEWTPSTRVDFDGKTYEVEEPTKPAIMMEGSRFRQLLRDLGFSAKVFWEPDGSRFFKVSRVELSTKPRELSGGVEQYNVPNSLMRIPAIHRVIECNHACHR